MDPGRANRRSLLSFRTLQLGDKLSCKGNQRCLLCLAVPGHVFFSIAFSSRESFWLVLHRPLPPHLGQAYAGS
jgi:hypothetical protein